MKAMRYLLFICLVTFLAVSVAMSGSDTKEERQDLLFTCNCGPECKCNTVSTKPGNCTCGRPLKQGQVIKTEGNEAILCQCGDECQCKGIDGKDPSKCVCGTPVKRVSLAKTGIYFCNCGDSCYCNTVSDKPGKCKCGMELKKVD